MGLVKTRRLAAMQKQQKAKMSLPKPKASPQKRFAALLETNKAVTHRTNK